MSDYTRIFVVHDEDENEALYVNELLYSNNDTVFTSEIAEAVEASGNKPVIFRRILIDVTPNFEWPEDFTDLAPYIAKEPSA